MSSWHLAQVSGVVFCVVLCVVLCGVSCGLNGEERVIARNICRREKDVKGLDDIKNIAYLPIYLPACLSVYLPACLPT